MERQGALEKIMKSRWASLNARQFLTNPTNSRNSLTNPQVMVPASTVDPMFQHSLMKVLDESTYSSIETRLQIALRDSSFRSDLENRNDLLSGLRKKLEVRIGQIQSVDSLEVIKLANELDQHVNAAIYLCNLADEALKEAVKGLNANNEQRKAMITAMAKAVGSVCAIAIPPPAGPILGTIVVSVFTADTYTDMAGNLVGGILEAKTGDKKDRDVKIKGSDKKEISQIDGKKFKASGEGVDATVGDGMGEKGGDILKASIALIQDASGMTDLVRNSKVKTPLNYLSQRGSPPSDTLKDFDDLKNNIKNILHESVQLIFNDLQEIANQIKYQPKALAKALIDYESKVTTEANLFLKELAGATSAQKRPDDQYFVHDRARYAEAPEPSLVPVPEAHSRFLGIINNSSEIRQAKAFNELTRKNHMAGHQDRLNQLDGIAHTTIVNTQYRAIQESVPALEQAAQLFINTRSAKMLSTIFARTGKISENVLAGRRGIIFKEFQIACVAAHFNDIGANKVFNKRHMFASRDQRFEELKDSVKLAATDPSDSQNILMIAENFSGRTGAYLRTLGLISKKNTTALNRAAGKDYNPAHLATQPAIIPIPYHSDSGAHSRVIMRAFAVEYSRVSEQRLKKAIMGDP